MGGANSTDQEPVFHYGVFVGSPEPNSTAVLRHPDFTEGPLERPSPDVNTIQDLINRSFSNYADKNCLGTNVAGEYQWRTYAQVQEEATALGSALVNLNLFASETYDGRDYRFIGLYSKNRAEWVITDLASVLYNLTTVTFYDSLGSESMEYILQQTQLTTIVVAADNIENVLREKQAGRTSALTTLILLDKASDDLKQRCQSLGLALYDFEEMLNLGRASRAEYIPAQPESVFTLCYTSGTTGLPKGVILTHRMAVARTAGVMHVIKFRDDDVSISYLPLPHVYERCVELSLLYAGAAMGFYSGDVLTLRNDLLALKPTIFNIVPRLMTRFYDMFQAQFGALPGPLQKVYKAAVSTKLAQLRFGKVTHPLYDALFFNKAKAAIGGRVRAMITGSAPVKKEVIEYLQIAFGIVITEGYGQTETFTAGTLTNLDDARAGFIGGPTPSVGIKLEDIPEMNYTSRDVDENGNPTARGEICFRGPSVTPGYFKLPDKTAEAIDANGWLHSGDVGVIRQDGSIVIIDRKKNIFKLAQGEYIAPEKIENLYQLSPFVALNFVYGDSFQPFVIGIIVPDQAVLTKFAQENNIQGSFEELCENPQVKDAVLANLTRIGREGNLLSFEQVKKIHLTSNPFTIENGLLTPTFKVKRPEAKIAYQAVIDQLYA